MPPTDPVPTAALIVCEQRGEVHYEAKFRYGGHQVKRRIGRAWLSRDDVGRHELISGPCWVGWIV